MYNNFNIYSYCPGIDGMQYTSYKGYFTSPGDIVQRDPADQDCGGSKYTNGGSPCYTCSPGDSDRSKCIDTANNQIRSQFAESYYNEKDEREGVHITCLDSALENNDAVVDKSGAGQETCGIEASDTVNYYPPDQCDGIRDTDNDTKLGDPKNKHTVSHYGKCSWCPDDLNCQYHNSYFTFFKGYLLECPYGEYSSNGDLDCHRKNIDNFCKDGYYRAIHKNDKDNQWIHDQDKRYECIPINQNPSTDYVAVDSTKTLNCDVGDYVRYGGSRRMSSKCSRIL